MTRHEHADIIGAGPSRELAERMATWIRQTERSEGAWVVGLYGGRGAGKTSVLLTLLDRLAQHDTPKRLPLVLPNATDKQGNTRAVSENLLKPAAMRDHDELLFELLRYLEDRYPHPSLDKNKDPFQRARASEVQRKDIKRFLDYEKDVVASDKELRKRTIDVHKEVADSTEALRKAFAEILSQLRTENQTLVILVDDMDLRPDRALELLETFHIFLDQPGVVIVLAADKELLLDAIAVVLAKDRGLKRSDLAAALLAKYVPYEWHIPVPTEAQRFDLLWPSAPSPPLLHEHSNELWRWWPSQENHQARFGSDPTVRAFAEKLLPEILPSTYRGLKAYSNRLEFVRQAFTLDANGHVAIRKWLAELGLDEILLPAFVSAVIAIDVAHPRLALWNHLRMHPDDLRLSLAALAKQFEELKELKGPEDLKQPKRSRPKPILRPTKDVGADAANLRSVFELFKEIRSGLDDYEEDDDELNDPFDEQRLLFQSLNNSDRQEANEIWLRKEHLIHLSSIWQELSSSSRRIASADANSESSAGTAQEPDNILPETPEHEPARRFFCVSVNADAMQKSESEWKARFERAAVADWHLDLHDLIRDPDYVTASELVTARDQAARFLRDRGIASFSGAVDVFLKASHPFAIWLGWKLRYLQHLTIYSHDEGKFIPFPSPRTTLPFVNTGRPELFESFAERSHGEENQDAIVLIDLLGISKAEQIDRFIDARGESVRCRLGRHLILTLKQERIGPQHTEPFLHDCIEVLGQLKRQGIERVHLGVSVPDFMAFLLGRQLHARMQHISLYEYRRTKDCYEYIFDLESHG